MASKIHKFQLQLKWKDPGWTKQSLREEKHQPGKEDRISNQDLENALFNTYKDFSSVHILTYKHVFIFATLKRKSNLKILSPMNEALVGC